MLKHLFFNENNQLPLRF